MKTESELQEYMHSEECLQTVAMLVSVLIEEHGISTADFKQFMKNPILTVMYQIATIADVAAKDQEHSAQVIAKLKTENAELRKRLLPESM